MKVVPREATAELGGHLFPGFSSDNLVSEIRKITGHSDGNIEVTSSDPGPGAPEMGLFRSLAGVLEEEDEDAVPVPMVMPASLDGRLFANLGIQVYVYLPISLPKKFDFATMAHGAVERIPV